MTDIPLDFESPFIMTEVIFKNDQGIWIEAQPFNQELRFNGYSIGYFSRRGMKSGTGFVLEIENDKSSLKSGIILTAAHIFYKNFVYTDEIIDFILGSETFEARPKTRTFDWEDETKFLIDPVKKERISYPDDWILCEIWRKTTVTSTRIVPLSINKEICLSEGIEVFVVGYPFEITTDNLDYSAPGSESNEIKFVQKSILNGQELVISSGKILKIGQMIAISCISSNGFSGSPVLVDSNGELKFIGLMHGGPASFLHKGISCLIHNSVNPNLKEKFQRLYDMVKEFKNKKKGLRLHRNYYLADLLSLLKRSIKVLDKNREISEAYLINTYKQYYRLALTIEVSYGFKIFYNLCYPVSEFLT